jgi:hypothetical protein
VTFFYKHEDAYEVTHHYYVESQEDLDAPYSSYYGGWYVVVPCAGGDYGSYCGKAFIIAWSNEVVHVDPDVVIVRPPSDWSEPAIVVVPPSNSEPPTAVPGPSYSRPDNSSDEPPTAVPQSNSQPPSNNDEPPTAVPY